MANNRNDRKEQRRQEAEERQAAYNALTDDEKRAKQAAYVASRKS